MLRGFCFQFLSSREERHIGQVYAQSIFAQFPFQLANSLKERQTFYVAHSSANLRYHEIKVVFVAQIKDVAFYFVRDVRHHLYGFSQIVASALFFNHVLVYSARGKVVVARGFYAGESFVVSEVKVGFLSVCGYVALTVLVGIQSTRIHIDVWVKLLDSYVISACLQEFANGRRDNSLAKRRGNAAGYKDVFCFSHDCI